MSRVGLRIFVTLWGALILIALSVAAVGMSVFMSRIGIGERNPVPAEREALTALATGGRSGLRNWLIERGPELGYFRVMVLDESGQDLSGQPLPRIFARWRPPASKGEEGNADFLPPEPFARLRGSDGATYRLVLLPPPDSPVALLGLRDGRVLLGALALLVTGALSFWLARTLTRPLTDLTRTTQAIAAGDLSARPEPNTLSRQDEVGQLARSFLAMAERVQHLLSSRDRLLADVAHELRSPLARLRMAIGLVAAEQPANEAQLARADREAERLGTLIGDVLAIARLDATAHLTDSARLDLGALFREVIDDARFEGAERHVSVIDELPAADLNVFGHEQELRSAFENVVRNALRHEPIGGSIVVRGRSENQWVIVDVIDHGPGVAADELKAIFDPFYRTSRARASDSVGTGFGLAITSRVMTAHNGEVQAANLAAGGLCIRFRLPLAVSA